MFYHGLDFHDLAPDAILHISSFIIMCEAFLHVNPHFGLWLKSVNVKPKMIEGRHVECGGAVISRNADAPWPEGSFPEVSCMATEVVLCHGSQRHKVGSRPQVPLGPSVTVGILERRMTELGARW